MFLKVFSDVGFSDVGIWNLEFLILEFYFNHKGTRLKLNTATAIEN
jgi:hypothetical protein